MRSEGRLGVIAGLAFTCALASPVMAGISAVDDRGVTVSLARPAQRIVALAPHAAELVFAAGAGARLVGTVQWSDHPETARRVPRIGDAARLDMESVARLRPDLAVGWVSGNRSGDFARLERMGVRVFATEPGTVDAIAGAVARIGVLAGVETGALDLAAQLRDLDAAQGGKSPLRVFYEIWHTPPMTVGRRHFISDALRHCHAANVFADLSALAGAITTEAVLARRPDVIVAADSAAGMRWTEVFRRTGIPVTVVVTDPDSLQRPGPRLIAGTARLCRALDQARQKTSAAP